MTLHNRALPVSLLVLLLIAGCEMTEPSQSSRPTPEAVDEIDACTLITAVEAGGLVGPVASPESTQGSCTYPAADGTGQVVVDLVAAPNGTADLDDQRRFAEGALGPIQVATLDGIGDGAYYAQSGDGFQLRFVSGEVMVTVGVGRVEPLAADAVTRAEQLAREIVERL